MNVEQPSKFWERLATEHRRNLADYGFDACKRHQALRYFTWRWSWSSVSRSEQMRFLLKNSPVLRLFRCGVTPTRLSDRDWEGIPWPKRDRWLYAFATRLLWLYAQGCDTTGTTQLAEPELGQPPPVRWGGRVISQDLANSSLEVAAIRRALDHRPTSILEVGAGYGRTAYALLSLFPEAVYTIIDMEPAIEISRWYLSKLFSPDRLRFISFASPEEVAGIQTGSVDLAVTISSLQEMTPEQVDNYLRLFDRVASGGAVYVKQWIDWHNPIDQVEMRFDSYPIPEHWVAVFRERAPVQTNFIQAAWRVPEIAGGASNSH